MSLALDLPRLETTLHLPAQDELQQLLQGLLQPSARIDSKYLYDDRGCELFTDICRLDEYYPTRTEAHIFSDHRDAIDATHGSNATHARCREGAAALRPASAAKNSGAAAARQGERRGGGQGAGRRVL